LFIQILICQLETPLPATIKALEDFNGISILNAAPAMKIPDEVLKLPNIFCVNELEAEGVTGIEIKDLQSVKKSIKNLKNKGCQTVIVTLGKLGAAFNDERGAIIHVPVQTKVNVVDTVGAGDAFIGALAFFISRFPNASLLQKIGGSIEIASHSVELKGTQTSFVNFPSIDPTTKNYKFEEIL
jgi:ribokinase